MFIKTYSELYGIRSVVLRHANVVGPRLMHEAIYDFIVKLRRDPRTLIFAWQNNGDKQAFSLCNHLFT
jgi:nucleoside-diphosphate-sugar epimerase